MNDELRLDTETVCVTETVLDCVEELTLERDFVLPDYYPDVFRVLRCSVEPRLTSQSVSGDRLTFEVMAIVKVLYLTEGSRRINCIEQDVELSRTLSLDGSCPDPEVIIDLSCRGVTCRAKGSRRMDVRGTVCAAVKVCCCREKRIVTGGSGCGIQLKKQTISYPIKRLTASKRVTVIQQISLPEDKPAVGTVLRTGCTILRSERRIVAGKLAVKGEAELEVLYACIDKAGEDSVQSLRFTLPFSQIVDMDGVDDSFEVDARVTPAGCSLIPGSGEEKTAEWELVLNVFCTAEKLGTGVGVTDVFSTEYSCQPEDITEISSGRGEISRLNTQSECTLNAPDGTVGMIFDCCSSCTRPTVRMEDGISKISGSVTCWVMGEGSEGGIFCAEGQSPYEAELSLPEGCGVCDVEVTADAAGCSYYLGEGGSIKVKTDLKLCCKLRSGGSIKLIGGVLLDKDTPAVSGSSCALRLCRCNENEDIWDIAKRYHTSVEAIMEDNELAEDASDVGSGRLIVIRN